MSPTERPAPARVSRLRKRTIGALAKRAVFHLLRPMPGDVIGLRYVLGVLWLALGLSMPSALAQTGSGSPAASVTSAAPPSVETLLTETRAELERSSADAAPESPAARYRSALNRRLALLDELGGLVARDAELASGADGLSERLAAVEAELAKLTAQPEPVEPGTPTEQAFQALEKQVSEQRELVSGLRAEQTERSRRIDEELPRLVEESRKRAAEAAKRREQLAGQAAGASEAEERRVLEAQARNAVLDERVARRTVTVLEAEAQLLPQLEPLRGRELDVAEQHLARLEAEYGLYGQALSGELERRKTESEAELARREQAVETARTPAERFLAEWAAVIARSENFQRRGQTQLVGLKKDVAEQEKRLASEKDELTALRDLMDRSGTSGFAGERINSALRQADARRRVIERALRSGLGDVLSEFPKRRFEVDDLLFGINERFVVARDAALAELAESERPALRAKADALLPEVRDGLREEKGILTEVLGVAQNLQVLLVERLDLLEELERFIRARAFWLRDGRPMGVAALQPLGRELRRLGAWLTELSTEDSRAEVLAAIRSGIGLVVGSTLLIALPVLLFYLRQRLRGLTRQVNDRVVAEGRRPALLLLVVVTGFSSALMLPAYFVVVALVVGSTPLPGSLHEVVARSLDHFALFLFLWFLSRSFFGARSISEVQFEMDHRAANAFHAAMVWLIFGYGLLLAPSDLLARAPFAFQALPRVLYTLFLLSAAAGVVLLVRAGSPFVQHALTHLDSETASRHWRSIAGLLMLLVAVVLVLDLLGYRYASRSIGESLLATLAVMVILPVVFRRVMHAMRGVRRLRQRTVTEELTGEEDETSTDLALRTEGFVRMLFVIIGIAIVLSLWGIDQQALRTLEDVSLYSVRVAGAEPEFVTAGDLLRAVLFVVGTFWILRALPGLYEVAIFPRLNLDQGVMYATLTISRYTVFVVGLFLALSAVHLDLGRLGWLMAAIGVGLGFGLQEIVSNFVSGIILLIERPVRPGDVVSVGNMTGTVQRINIRATTILNYDRQEVMLPNRSLITREVTNWTRGDTTNRVVVAIGVAYGSDVDRVSELLREVASGIEHVLADPGPVVAFLAHGESSLDFEVRVYVPSPKEILVVRDALNKGINKAFAAAGIEIPFPQRDLHIRSGALPAGSP